MAALEDLARIPGIALLAAARAHTEGSALRVLSEFGYDMRLFDFLKQFGYLWRAGHEWTIDQELRKAVESISSDVELTIWREAHSYYFDVANHQESYSDQPAYIAYGPGSAYHGTELDPVLGAEGYKTVAHVDSLAVSLEAMRLATEQGRRGLIDLSSSDLRFLRGMTYYRMGRMHEAIDVLRPISKEVSATREVSVAQHLVAVWDCKRGSERDSSNAPELFRASLKIASIRGDVQHQSHVLHSMAICMLERKDRDYYTILDLLEKSLKLNGQLDDEWGRAKILHSLGQVLGQRRSNRDRALAALNESVSIGKRLGYQEHVSKVLESISRAKAGKTLDDAVHHTQRAERNRKARARKSRRQNRRDNL